MMYLEGTTDTQSMKAMGLNANSPSSFQPNINKLEPCQRRPTQCFNKIMANLSFQGNGSPQG